MGKFSRKIRAGSEVLAGWMETPLTRKRHHQPHVYNAVHGVTMAAAVGWTTYALTATMGALALPFYLVTAATSFAAFRQRCRNLARRARPLARADVTTQQVVSMVLPLAENVGHSFARQTGMNCTMGFLETGGLCHFIGVDRQRYIIIAPDNTVRHHKWCVDQHGQRKGSEAFVKSFAAIMAHERAHSRMPKWRLFCDYGSMAIASLLAPVTAMASAVAGFVPMPEGPACAWALFGSVSAFLCGKMANRAEELRADREGVEFGGKSRHITTAFSSSRPSVAAVVFGLCFNHPSANQRIAAARACSRQLTPAEKAAGEQRLNRIVADVLPHHQHLFQKKTGDGGDDLALHLVRRIAVYKQQ